MTSSTSRGAGYSAAQCATASRTVRCGYDPAALQHDPDPLAQRRGRAPGVMAEHRHVAAPCASGSPRGSRPSSSCRRRWGPAGRRPRRATAEVDAAHGLVVAVGLAQAATSIARLRTRRHDDGRSCLDAPDGADASAPASTSARTPRACSSPSATDGRPAQVLQRARLHAPRACATRGAIPRRARSTEVRASSPRRSSARGRARGAAACASVATAAIRGAPRPRRVRSALRDAPGGGRGARRATRRRGWRSWAPPRRSPTPAGTRGGGRRRRRLDRDRGRHGRRRASTWSRSFPVGSGVLAERLPAIRPADARRSSARAARHAMDVLRGARVRRRADCAVRGRRQRGLAAHASPARRSTRDAARARCDVLCERPARRRRRAARARRRARAPAPGGPADPRRRRPALRRPLRIGRGGLREGVVLEHGPPSRPRTRARSR